MNIQGKQGDEIVAFLTLLKKTIVQTYESRFGFGEAERMGYSWTDITIRDPFSRDDLLRQKLLHELEARKIDHQEDAGARPSTGAWRSTTATRRTTRKDGRGAKDLVAAGRGSPSCSPTSTGRTDRLLPGA